MPEFTGTSRERQQREKGVYALGVDLGTAFTAAAVSRGGHAEIVSLGSRSAAIPSVVVLLEDTSILTGEAAVRRALLEPSRTAREFKRRFGDPVPLLLGGTPCSAESLTARLLRSVVREVTAQQGGPPSAVCLCHPATWGPYKTDLLQQAVRMAELEVPVTFTAEPAAAAAHYALRERLAPGALVAVYDLGGGTFDAAVLRKTATGFTLVGTPEGIEHLGGADVDAAVFQHVRTVVGVELDALDENLPSTVAAVARLREECVAAKETLSSDTDTTIPVLLPGLATEVRLTRVELEATVRPLIYDTVDALRRAVRSAGVTPADLHSVLLVGGASRMPLVAQIVGAELDRPIAVDAHPKHAVALGAAWTAERHQTNAASRRTPARGDTPASGLSALAARVAAKAGLTDPPPPAPQTIAQPTPYPPPAPPPGPALQGTATPRPGPPGYPITTPATAATDGRPPSGFRRGLLAAAASAAVILLVALAGFLAGRAGLFDGFGP